MSVTQPTTEQLNAYAQYTSLQQELSKLLNQIQQIPNPPAPPQLPTSNDPASLSNYYSSLAEYYQNLQSYSQSYGNTITQNLQILQQAMQIVNQMEGLLNTLGLTDSNLQQVANQISQNINYFQQLQNATQINYSSYIAFFNNLANAYSQISQYQQLPSLPQAPTGSVSLTEAAQYYSNLANWLTQNSSTVQQNISALQGAIQALQAALNNVPSGYNVSQLQQQLQQWQQALSQLQNLENLNPQQLQNTATAYSLWAQGITALNQGDYQDASNDFNQALQAVGLSPPSSPTQKAPSSQWAALFYLSGLANALLNSQNIQNQYQQQLNQLGQQISSQEGGNISPQLLQTISQFYSTLSQELAQVKPYFEQASQYGANVGVKINADGYDRASKLAANLAKLASDMANALQQLSNSSTQNPNPANQASQILMGDQGLVNEINSLASSLPSSFSSLVTDAQSLVSGYNELTKSSTNAYTFYSGVKQVQQYLNQQDYQDAYNAAVNLANSLGISVSINDLTQQSYQPPSNDPEVETVYYLLLLSKWGLTYQSITNQYQQRINSLASSISSSNSMQQTFSTYAQIFNLMHDMYNTLQQIIPAGNAAFSYFGEPTFPQNYFATAAELMKKASDIATQIANDLANGNYEDIEKMQLNFSELSQLQSMNNNLTQGMTSSIQQNISNFAIAVANLQYNIAFTNSINGALQQVNNQQNQTTGNQNNIAANRFFRGGFGNASEASSNSSAQTYQQLSQAYAQAAQQIETITQKQAAGSVQIPGVGTVNARVPNDLVNSANQTAQKMKLLSQAYNALAQASQNSNDPQTALQNYQTAYNDFTQAGVDPSKLSNLQSVISFYQYLVNNQGTLQSIQSQLQEIGNLTPQVNNNSVKLGSAALVASAATMPSSQMRSTVEQATGLDQIKQQIDSYYDNFPSLPQDLQEQVDKMHRIADTTVDLYTNILVARAYTSVTQLPNVSADQQIQALQNAKQALENAKQDTQTLQGLGINVDPSQILQSITNINQSVNEIQTIQGSSQQLQNILEQIKNQLQTPQDAETLTSNLMNLSNQGLQIINNIIATYQKYGQSPDQSILSLQKKLQKIYDNAYNEYKWLTGQQASQSFTQSASDIATGNIGGAIVSGLAGAAESVTSGLINIGANFVSTFGIAINDILNDLSNFITHAIPGIAGQIIAGIVIGGLFSLLQFLPGINAAVDTLFAASIMASTMGAAIQQYYLSGISDPRTIVTDIGESFITPEGIAALISGVGFSIGLPRVIDNVGDLFKSTDDVKVTGVIKSLDNAKVDLDNIQAKIGDSLKNLKLDKTNIDVTKVTENLRDLNDLLSIKGVLEGIKDYLDKLTERLNGILKIDAKVRVTEKGIDIHTAEVPLRGEEVASLTTTIQKIEQAAEITMQELKSSLKITDEGVEIKGGSNNAITIANKEALYTQTAGNLSTKTEIPPEGKIGLPKSETVKINTGELHGTAYQPDLVELNKANLAETNLEQAVNEFSQIPKEISELEAQFDNNKTFVLDISKEFADYLHAKYDALRSQIENISSTMLEIHQNNPDFEAAEEEIAQLGLRNQLDSALNEIKTLDQKLIELRKIGNLLKAVKEKTTIDIEPLLKDYVDGKIDNIYELANMLNEKLYDYYKPQIDSLENNILSDLQKKGATPDQIAQVKSEIDKLVSNQIDEFINPTESTDTTQVLENVSGLVDQLNKIEELAKNASNANDMINIIDERLGGGSGTQYETQANTKTENQPLGSNNISQPTTPQNTPGTTSQTPGTTASNGIESQTGSGQIAVQMPKEAVKSAESNVLNLSLKYSLSDIINTARQTLGEDFDRELYAFSKLFGQDSINQAILDAVNKSPTPDLDSIARTLGDVIESKVDEVLRTSPDKAVATIEDMLKINNDLVKSKLTTDLLDFIKNNPKATFNDLLTFTEKDLPKIVNDVKDTLTNSVLDQLSKGFGNLTNLIGKDSLKTFLENEIKNGVFDVNKLLDDAKAFMDSKLTEILKSNPEQVLSTILDAAKIGNKLIRDKLLTDTLNFVKRFGGNVTLKDIAEFIAKDASDLKTQLAKALKSGNLKELENTLPALKNVLDDLKKEDPVRVLREYLKSTDPILAEALNRITPDNALDILDALKNNDLTKIAEILDLSVDQLERPEVKLSIISEILDDLMKKLKAKQITYTEFKSAIESFKQIIDEMLPEYKSLLEDYSDELEQEAQDVEDYVDENKLSKLVVELYKVLVPSTAALPVIFSIASNSDLNYLLNYAEQLASEEQTPLVSQQIPQQEVQAQQSTTVLSTPAEPESPLNSEPLAPPPIGSNQQEQPEYPMPTGPNAPALPNRNTRSVSGETQKQILYFPIS
ncbi:MAG: hypothetical protein QW342_06675 [Thermoproteota archaeon]